MSGASQSQRKSPQGGNEEEISYPYNDQYEGIQTINLHEDENIERDLEQYQKNGLEDVKARLRMFKDERQSELLTTMIQLEMEQRQHTNKMRKVLVTKFSEMNKYRSIFQDDRYRDRVPRQIKLYWPMTKGHVIIDVTRQTTVKELCLFAATYYAIPEYHDVLLSDEHDGFLHHSMTIMSLYWCDCGDPGTPTLTVRAPVIEERYNKSESEWKDQLKKLKKENVDKWVEIKKKARNANVIRFSDIPWPHWVTIDLDKVIDQPYSRDSSTLSRVSELTNHIIECSWSDTFEEKQSQYIQLIDTWRLDYFFNDYGNTMDTNDVVYIKCRLCRIVNDIQSAWDYIANT